MAVNFYSNWLEKYEALVKQRARLIQDAHLMSGYEYERENRAYNEAKERYYPDILAGARGMMAGAIKKYLEAQEREQRARRAELNRWDSARLADEMRLAEARVKAAVKVGDNELTGASIAARIEGIFNEAKLSFDIHKQRGIYEALAGSLSDIKPGTKEDTRFVVNRIAQEAAHKLDEVRVTGEISQARQAVSESIDNLLEAREQVCRIGEFIDGMRADNPVSGSQFGYIVRKVGLSHDGIVIYPDNAVEVTGVMWPEVIA